MSSIDVLKVLKIVKIIILQPLFNGCKQTSIEDLLNILKINGGKELKILCQPPLSLLFLSHT